ncbi:hypothetical protein FACS189476_00690 [Spirochaetia bacterium]|nr:hypothetical protein FACS189476_00690 [Spirochaetia bacterium]
MNPFVFIGLGILVFLFETFLEYIGYKIFPTHEQNKRQKSHIKENWLTKIGSLKIVKIFRKILYYGLIIWLIYYCIIQYIEGTLFTADNLKLVAPGLLFLLVFVFKIYSFIFDIKYKKFLNKTKNKKDGK